MWSPSGAKCRCWYVPTKLTTCIAEALSARRLGFDRVDLISVPRPPALRRRLHSASTRLLAPRIVPVEIESPFSGQRVEVNAPIKCICISVGLLRHTHKVMGKCLRARNVLILLRKFQNERPNMQKQSSKQQHQRRTSVSKSASISRYHGESNHLSEWRRCIKWAAKIDNRDTQGDTGFSLIPTQL